MTVNKLRSTWGRRAHIRWPSLKPALCPVSAARMPAGDSDRAEDRSWVCPSRVLRGESPQGERQKEVKHRGDRAAKRGRHKPAGWWALTAGSVLCAQKQTVGRAQLSEVPASRKRFTEPSARRREVWG